MEDLRELDWLYLGQEAVRFGYDEDDDEDDWDDFDDEDDEDGIDWGDDEDEEEDDDLDEDDEDDDNLFYSVRTFFAENIDLLD